jgi:hypothetical protein
VIAKLEASQSAQALLQYIDDREALGLPLFPQVDFQVTYNENPRTPEDPGDDYEINS